MTVRNVQPIDENRAPIGADLARELRRLIDTLGVAVDDGNEYVCTIEDAHGLEYPEHGEAPDAEEQGRARANLAAALDGLAKSENSLKHQLWLLARTRRNLARVVRKERSTQ